MTGQYTLTWASQRISGIQVAIAHNSSVRTLSFLDIIRLASQVVFGVLAQWVIYGNHPSWTAGLGMMIIVASGIYASVCNDYRRSMSRAGPILIARHRSMARSRSRRRRTKRLWKESICHYYSIGKRGGRNEAQQARWDITWSDSTRLVFFCVMHSGPV